MIPQTAQREPGPEAPQPDSLKKAIVISLALHLLLFLAFTVRAVFYSSESIDLDDAIRVDMVALPDKKTAELPPPTASKPSPAKEPPKAAEPKAQPKPEPPAEKPAPKVALPKPEEPKVNLKKTREEQAAALKRLEALERLEKAESTKSSKTPPKAATPGPDRPSAVVKGNTVSTGNSLTGLVKAEARGYLASIQGIVKRHWNLPQWLASANLSARARIYIDSSGTVIKRELIRSSNNPDFDQRVLSAIDSSSPLPAPPRDLVNVLSVDGFDADFP